MGDGNIKRVAVIINGDGEPRHLENVERASKLLRDGGYELYVASPQKPSNNPTMYVAPNSRGILDIGTALTNAIDDDDEVVIYTTGHGGEQSDGCLSLPNQCISASDAAFKRLLSLPHGQRTVVMDQCYSGNWARLFSADPKTLFISAGSRGETVCCQDFIPELFSDKDRIPDANRDGAISWQERYMYVQSRKASSRSAFLPGSDYHDKGVAGTVAEASHFDTNVHEVRSYTAFQNLLKTLKPGDVAVVDVGMHGCGACTAYAPEFRRIAAEAKGRALFISIPYADEPGWDALDVHSFPTVLLVNNWGANVVVSNKSDPLAERSALLAEMWENRSYCLERLKVDRDAWKKIPAKYKSDRAFVLEAVRISGSILGSLPQNFQKDREIVLSAVSRSGIALRSASSEFRKDREVALAAIRSDSRAFRYVDAGLKQQKQFVLEAVRLQGYALGYVDETFQKDRDVVLTAVRSHGGALRYADKTFQKDRSVVLEAVRGYGDALEHADASLQDDRDVVLEAMHRNHTAIRYASQRLQQDRELALLAVSRYGWVLRYLIPEFQRDKEIVIAAVGHDASALRYAHPTLRDDKELVTMAVRRHPEALEFASPRLKKDKEVVLAAISLNADAFEFADDSLKSDRSFYLDAVKEKPDIIALAPPALCDDAEFLMAAVELNGSAIQYVPNAHKKDGTLILAARKTYDQALAFADPSLFQSKEFMMQAVRIEGGSLHNASDALRADKDVVLEAVKHDGLALEFASYELQEDAEVVRAALSQNPGARRFTSWSAIPPDLSGEHEAYDPYRDSSRTVDPWQEPEHEKSAAPVLIRIGGGALYANASEESEANGDAQTIKSPIFRYDLSWLLGASRYVGVGPTVGFGTGSKDGEDDDDKKHVTLVEAGLKLELRPFSDMALGSDLKIGRLYISDAPTKKLDILQFYARYTIFPTDRDDVAGAGIGLFLFHDRMSAEGYDRIRTYGGGITAAF
jgi:hypothetical protein